MALRDGITKRALVVACPTCDAPIGKPCRTTRSRSRGHTFERAPHESRKDAVRSLDRRDLGGDDPQQTREDDHAEEEDRQEKDRPAFGLLYLVEYKRPGVGRWKIWAFISRAPAPAERIVGRLARRGYKARVATAIPGTVMP